MISERAFMLKKDGTPTYNCLCRNPELIENYDAAIADTTKVWECHHRLETHNSDGERRLVDLTIEELIALDMYYDRPSKELIFLTISEHMSLHQKGKTGYHRSEETKAKIAEAKKGENNPMYGKHPSEETKKKLSEAHKGKPSNTKGKHWHLVNGKRIYY